jgi:2-polyprenyl-3-methyl-5-hydroxy-6-metoxy-1,4-benzoquinol methylase
MADADYRNALFERYNERVGKLDPDRPAKVAWFREYVAENYLTHVRDQEPGKARVLDVGCSRGYLLEAMAALGWGNLTGVDLSPHDVEEAVELVPHATFVHAPAIDFLSSNAASFDIVVARAILEHTPKPEVLPFLAAAANALRADGVVIIDVPNMDWLFAGHERYMDLTHEVGFTRESLAQVMEGPFDEVVVRTVDHLSADDRASFRTRLGRRLMSRILEWADPQGASNPIWHRNLVAIGRHRET